MFLTIVLYGFELFWQLYCMAVNPTNLPGKSLTIVLWCFLTIVLYGFLTIVLWCFLTKVRFPPLGNAFSINLLKILLSVVFLLSSCILCLGQSDYRFCIMKYRDQIPQYTRISIWSKLHIINSYYIIIRKYTVLYWDYAGRSTNRVVMILLSLKYTWQEVF